MKSEVHVSSEDEKAVSVCSVLEAAIAQALWYHPERFTGLEKDTLNFSVQIKFGDKSIGHTCQVS